mmetsp:Transcript_10607/g.47799  ORF Transcript_10607/g.47799 Transcript_10607/m.47799 type:complete len:203 (-) Transcript_10607:289-897(-)
MEKPRRGLERASNDHRTFAGPTPRVPRVPRRCSTRRRRSRSARPGPPRARRPPSARARTSCPLGRPRTSRSSGTCSAYRRRRTRGRVKGRFESSRVVARVHQGILTKFLKPISGVSTSARVVHIPPLGAQQGTRFPSCRRSITSWGSSRGCAGTGSARAAGTGPRAGAAGSRSPSHREERRRRRARAGTRSSCHTGSRRPSN